MKFLSKIVHFFTLKLAFFQAMFYQKDVTNALVSGDRKTMAQLHYKGQMLKKHMPIEVHRKIEANLYALSGQVSMYQIEMARLDAILFN